MKKNLTIVLVTLFILFFLVYYLVTGTLPRKKDWSETANWVKVLFLLFMLYVIWISIKFKRFKP